MNRDSRLLDDGDNNFSDFRFIVTKVYQVSLINCLGFQFLDMIEIIVIL